MQSRRCYGPRNEWKLACCFVLATGCAMDNEASGAAQPNGYGDSYGYGSEYGAGGEYGYAEQNQAVAGATLQATIDGAGGELAGAPNTLFASVRLRIPAGALSSPTWIEIAPASASTPLPSTAVAYGPMFAIKPAGLALLVPAMLTLPVDATRAADDVQVWVLERQEWSQRQQIESSSSSVTVELDTLGAVAAGADAP